MISQYQKLAAAQVERMKFHFHGIFVFTNSNQEEQSGQ